MIHTFVCTRSDNLSPITKRLVSYLDSIDIKTTLFIGHSSIFRAYSRGLRTCDLSPDDIVILCHDDIQILSDREDFKETLERELSDPRVGFVGVAGTTLLGKDAVWWNHENWKAGKHRGFIFHGSKADFEGATSYGACGQVVVLDGVFLAARVSTLQKIGLDKPSYFSGEWDFYDIHYTYTAHKMGLENRTVPIILCHSSKGELAGRDSWHKNRESFIKNSELPCEIK